MKHDLLYPALLAAYGAVWRMARPVLRRNARLAEGFDQRMVPEGWADAAHLWVQAASGGEAYLAWELLRHLDAPARQDGTEDAGQQGDQGDQGGQDSQGGKADKPLSPLPGPQDGCRAPGEPLSVLCTSCTRQGVEVLEKARDWAAEHRPDLRVQVRYFPFDEPALMRQALDQVRPCAVALLETELWPGLLSSCHAQGVPVAVLNGRMTPRSLSGYLLAPGLWKRMPPAHIAAISADDARRFGLLFGDDRTSVMPNIKFDRTALARAAQHAPNPLAGVVLRADAPLVVLGSVREEEEAALLPVITRIREACPQADIAVAPRHMHRVPAWVDALAAAGHPWVLRSNLTAPPAPGSVVLWDVFGELAQLYEAASAVFVGGSLAPLGGQNFLEPLGHGIVPCVGPSRENFAWTEQAGQTKQAGLAGQGLSEAGLLREVRNAAELAEALVAQMAQPEQRADVLRRFGAWLAPRRGGGRMAAERLLSVAGMR